MIGSFWNLCRACPSMPVDKLHSEYRSTYRWHEYTGPRQDVVRRPPQPHAAHIDNIKQSNDLDHKDEFSAERNLPKLEPAMPRRKKYPDLAYRRHEFLTSDGDGISSGFCNTESSRARSEERGPHWRASRRSKSEGPRGCGAHGDGMRERERRRESDPDLENMGRETGLLRKAISKISTEYRLQFAWPQGHISRRDAADASTPRKSQSMGALKAQSNAMIHKKRIDMENKDAAELEPLVDERSNNIREDKTHVFKDETEYKKKFRPFSQYEYTEGRFVNKRNMETEEMGHNSLPPNCEYKGDSWYREVVEQRKKAGEYKSFTKEEKEVDNNNKTSPSKTVRNTESSARMVRDMIRHHLERTTGGSELDGLILSPTREKLEPTIPRKDDDSRGSQKNSPKKSSPMKSSSLKRHGQKSAKAGPKNLRSQSVGPITDSSSEKRSPKRQSRSATVKERKSSASTATAASNNKRPRPSDPPNSKSENDADKSKNSATVEGPEIIEYEPVVKSPPEPTRVKSPEQILMRSPDPVNWTVPLDTGKTFTVTQNVREGEIGSRPHSEVKAWTPPEVPLPVAQSAPPALTENKEQGMS